MSTTESPTTFARKQLMNEIRNNRSQELGDKKFHSEISLQNVEVGDDYTKDPGVLNESVNDTSSKDEDSDTARRRTLSQPGPVSGSLLTATAARAARKRPLRIVNYSDGAQQDATEKQLPRYLSPSDSDITAMSDRTSPLPYNGYRNNVDARSLNSNRLYASNNDLRGAATPRKRSVVTMDAQSIRSVETHAPPPTTPETKKQLTTKCLSITLSCTYAIMIVTIGLILYLSDTFIETTIAPYYSIALAIIGILYMIFLVVDIEKYKRNTKKNKKMKEKYEESLQEYFRKQEIELDEESPGTRTPEVPTGTLKSFPGISPPTFISVKHEYCFSQGRHSGSFYLKLGAAGFALGSLVHAVLLIAVQMGYYFDEVIDNEACVEIAVMAFDFINPIFCFFQLYFIFKYSNVIILRYQGFARFAFMHFIGTSLCFWVSAIVRETILALTLYAQSNATGNGYTHSTRSERSINVDRLNRFIDVSGLYNENCVGSNSFNTLFENFSPYLYPFSVEFNILIVAVYYIIWSNIGNCVRDNDVDIDGDTLYSDNNVVCKSPTADEDNDFSSNIVISADCHASNRGLFLGFVVTVITFGMLIIGFVFSSDGEDLLEAGYILSDCTRLFLHICMLVASVIAFNQIRQLDINEHPISLLDDILLFICLPAFFLETSLSLVATLSLENYIKTIDFSVMIIQVVIQTSLIVDAIRRCSNTRKLRRKKPGREIIMFLLITNVTMWIFYTFSYKSPDSLDERNTYYGKVLWSILGHISLPLMMFYRFHSSVCFADIWGAVYKPGSEH